MPNDAVTLFGTDAPQPTRHVLSAGPLSAVLEQGQLRRICWQGQEAIRGIAFLVRDISWGTYAAALENLVVNVSDQAFHVRYDARCADDKQALRYAVSISGHANGHLAFEAKLAPETDFATHRAGFIVLHPLEGVAGQPVTVVHTNGEVDHTHFPKHVVPQQPIFDIRSLEHVVQAGLRCRCTMEGDAFEMEDQRNWSDASFKTYVRPLAKGSPYTLPAGQTSEQAVRLEFIQTRAAPTLVSAQTGAHLVTLESGASGRLPELGLALDAEAPAPTPQALQALASLAPQWLVGRLELTTRLETLRYLAQAAAASRAKVYLELVVSCEQPIASELEQLAELVAQARLVVHAVVASPAALLKSVPSNFAVPGLTSLDELYAATRRAFPHALLGGGSLAYFTELNRNRPPTTGLAFITHTTCPIIHAADDDSVMQTLQTLPWLFESGQQFAGEAAYWLGPTSLGMRFNPYGPAPASNPHNERIATAKADPRQRGLFGAAFVTAYAAIAARAGLASLTFGALTGPHGVLYTPGPERKPGFDERGGVCYPAFHALRWLAQAANHPRVGVNVSGGGVEAVAHMNAVGNTTLLLANITPHEQPITIEGDRQLSLQMLDESSFSAATNAVAWSNGNGEPSGNSFTLLPYSVARACWG